MFLLTFRKSRKEEKEVAENLEKEAQAPQVTTTTPPTKINTTNEGSRSLSNILKHKSQSSSFKESSLISIKDSFSSKTRSSTLPFNRSQNISTTGNNNTSSLLDQSIDSSYASNNSIRVSSCGEHSSSSSGSNENNNLIMTTSTTNSNNNVPHSLLFNSEQISPIVQQPQSVKSTNNLSTSNSSTSAASTPSPSVNNSHNSNSHSTQSSYLNSESKNNSNKVNSVSYLDDSNLKLAIIDYSDILKLIKLQNSIEYQEWMAFNTKMYFDQINVLYGAIAEQCTPKTCPTMSAPLNNQFYWLDEKGKKCKYSASQYIDTVLTYAAKVTSDENLFPTKQSIPFPPHFETLVKKINKHLFQILAHMYHSHYTELLQLKLNTYVNSIYLHFYSFNKSFSILEDKEIEIMDALNKSLLNKHLDNTNSLQHQLIQQQPPMIHQPSSAANSSGSTGFSFFKKKLNFNLMA